MKTGDWRRVVLIAGFTALGAAFVGMAIFAGYGGLTNPESPLSRIAAAMVFGTIGIVLLWCALTVSQREGA